MRVKKRIPIPPQRSVCAWGEISIAFDPIIGDFYIECPDDLKTTWIEVEVDDEN